MTLATLLAQETSTKTLWNPTLLGILVVLSAIGLFCGSVYLLLSTNLGARLGFLVAAACLTGFLVLLSILWMTTFTPLESPKGHDQSWVVKEVDSNPTAAKIGTVRNIAQSGKPIDTSDLANIRPFMDGVLVRPAITSTIKPSPFNRFNSASDYITGDQGLTAFQIGGGDNFVFWHKPQYAVVEYCQTKLENVPFGEKPPAPTCDKLVPNQYVVLEHNLGSIRQPPIFFFISFCVLFALSLLGLHWYELDARERKARSLTPIPTA